MTVLYALLLVHHFALHAKTEWPSLFVHGKIHLNLACFPFHNLRNKKPKCSLNVRVMLPNVESKIEQLHDRGWLDLLCCCVTLVVSPI